MIVRDRFGIIVQHDPNDPTYLDGGDSASRTGIMSLCGSEEDRTLMVTFATKDGLVRHPYQAPWNDPKLTSRDQLVCFIAGRRTGLASVVRDQYGWFINKDFLWLDVQNHLRLCAGFQGRWYGFLALNISILWAAYVKPDAELNQLACMCIVAGPKYVQRLTRWHKTWCENITAYWSGFPFRDQHEVGVALISKIELYL